MNVKKLWFVHDSENCNGNLLPDCIFLTDECKLLIIGHCALCGNHIQVALTIEELIVACPPGGTKPKLLNPGILKEDAEFLHRLGIDPGG